MDMERLCSELIVISHGVFIALNFQHSIVSLLILGIAIYYRNLLPRARFVGTLADKSLLCF